jgi:L-aspartate oxidase
LESLVFAKRAAKLIDKDNQEKKLDLPDIDLKSYPEKSVRENEFKELIMNEIRGKDPEFYDKWCNNED